VDVYNATEEDLRAVVVGFRTDIAPPYPPALATCALRRDMNGRVELRFERVRVELALALVTVAAVAAAAAAAATTELTTSSILETGAKTEEATELTAPSTLETAVAAATLLPSPEACVARAGSD